MLKFEINVLASRGVWQAARKEDTVIFTSSRLRLDTRRIQRF